MGLNQIKWMDPYGIDFDMVDGNPAPVDMVNISLFFFYMVLYIPGGAGFLPSTVSTYHADR